MSKAIIKAYQTWANEICDGKKNALACREIGLEPWEVFKFTYEQGHMCWTISDNYNEILKQEERDKESLEDAVRNEGMISTGLAKQLTEAAQTDYFKQEYGHPITQENTDEERRKEERRKEDRSRIKESSTASNTFRSKSNRKSKR